MYKKTVRSFALGILFTASLIGAVYFFAGEDDGESLKEAKESVENAGYIILSEKEYDKLISKTDENTDSNKLKSDQAIENE